MDSAVVNDAHREAVKASPRVMAMELQKAAGQRLVAYATRNKSPKVVGRWAQGDHLPQGDTPQRLRNMYRTYLILKQREEDETFRAWLQSANPLLEDESPIDLLREGDQNAVKQVLRAAAEFLHD
jgi:hypothetical protein